MAVVLTDRSQMLVNEFRMKAASLLTERWAEPDHVLRIIVASVFIMKIEERGQVTQPRITTVPLTRNQTQSIRYMRGSPNKK